jgi:CDP-glycerol glycerophosphotransferase (TagB/SpsB family)
MGKPVVFYQFDYVMYMENHGSYLDLEHDLFGERYTELADVIESIRRNIADGFAESERAKEMRHKYFKYIDKDNSKRTYEYLKSKGY